MEKHYEIKKTINKIIREKKRFPSLQEMCNILHYTEDQTKKYMQVLAEDGYLEKTGDWYRFPDKNTQNSIDFLNEKLEEIKDISEEEFKERDQANDPVTIPVDITTDTLKETIRNKSLEAADEYIKNHPETIIMDDIDELEEKNKETKEEYDTSKLKLFAPQKLFNRIKNNIKNDVSFLLPIKKHSSKKRSRQEYSAPIYIIQILMGVIGIGASVISIYYTTVWLIEFLPWAFALLLSAIMVGFAVSAFETVILFLSGQVTRSRAAQWSITIGFVILWVSVTFFSIFSTIAGQYNKFVLNLQDQAKQGIDTGKMNWDSLQQQKEDLRVRLNEYRENSKTYTEISKTMQGLDKRTENDKTWSENQWRLKKANEEIKRLLDELNKIREEERILLKDSKDKGIILGVTKDTENIVNFYGWIAKIFNIDKDRAQFFMSLTPAIFVDFIGPISLAICLFLRNKSK